MSWSIIESLGLRDNESRLYISEAALWKWALSFLSHPDTVAVWLIVGSDVNHFVLADQCSFPWKQCRFRRDGSLAVSSRSTSFANMLFTFFLKALFVTIVVSKFIGGKVHLKIHGVKGINLNKANKERLPLCRIIMKMMAFSFWSTVISNHFPERERERERARKHLWDHET